MKWLSFFFKQFSFVRISRNIKIHLTLKFDIDSKPILILNRSIKRVIYFYLCHKFVWDFKCNQILKRHIKLNWRMIWAREWQLSRKSHIIHTHKKKGSLLKTFTTFSGFPGTGADIDFVYRKLHAITHV